MLKRPGLAFFSFQLWQLSHPHPEGAGPHRSLGVSKREEINPLPRRKRGRGASRAVRRSRGASRGRARGCQALGGCAAPGSEAARARAPVRGGAVRGHVRGSAPGEWSRSGGRGRQGRGRGGARTPSSTGLLEAAARLPAGGRQPPYPEPENLGLRGR